jgi:hypothetical protein
MRRTPYSPFVEKETAPVLWYVLVASLVLRFGGASATGGLSVGALGGRQDHLAVASERLDLGDGGPGSSRPRLVAAAAANSDQNRRI